MVVKSTGKIGLPLKIVYFVWATFKAWVTSIDIAPIYLQKKVSRYFWCSMKLLQK